MGCSTVNGSSTMQVFSFSSDVSEVVINTLVFGLHCDMLGLSARRYTVNLIVLANCRAHTGATAGHYHRLGKQVSGVPSCDTCFLPFRRVLQFTC